MSFKEIYPLEGEGEFKLKKENLNNNEGHVLDLLIKARNNHFYMHL